MPPSPLRVAALAAQSTSRQTIPFRQTETWHVVSVDCELRLTRIVLSSHLINMAEKIRPFIYGTRSLMLSNDDDDGNGSILAHAIVH